MTDDPPPAADPTPRPVIAAFAAAMERTLARHDAAKGEWRDEHPYALLLALEQEVAELRCAYDGGLTDTTLPDTTITVAEDHAALGGEACDVALYAMMLLDAMGLLPRTTDRGRRPARTRQIPLP